MGLIEILFGKRKPSYGPDYYTADGECFLDFEAKCIESAKGLDGLGQVWSYSGTPKANSFGNAYGSIRVLYKTGAFTPVICEHGGSMWLCLDCAEKIIQKE